MRPFQFTCINILFLLILSFVRLHAEISFHSKSAAWIVNEGSLTVPDTSQLYGWRNASFLQGNGYTGNDWTGYPDSPWTHTNLPTDQNLSGPITIAGPTYDQSTNLFISPDTAPLSFIGNTDFNGNGYFIQLSNTPGSIHIADNTSVTFSNITFKDFSDNAFVLGTNAHIYFGDGTIIELSQPTALTHNWACTGDVLINGHHTPLALGNYTINMSTDNILTLHGIDLQGLKHQNLFASTADGQIAINNSKLFLIYNFSFQTGSLSFAQDSVITGSQTFSYMTDQQSTIQPYTQLMLDTGITFEYNVPIADRDLFAMADKTSQLSLNGCTLSTTTTGLRLTRGTLIIDHKNDFYNNSAAALSEGFGLGDTYASGDLNLVIKPGASIDLKSGYLDYANVN